MKKDKIIAIISRHLNEDVAIGTKLHQETYMDSMDYAELSIAIETHFHFEARWSEWDALFADPELTVADIVRFVESKTNE